MVPTSKSVDGHELQREVQPGFQTKTSEEGTVKAEIADWSNWY